MSAFCHLEMSPARGPGRKPGRPTNGGSGSAADDAKAFIHGKAALLERLRAQRLQVSARAPKQMSVFLPRPSWSSLLRATNTVAPVSVKVMCSRSSATISLERKAPANASVKMARSRSPRAEPSNVFTSFSTSSARSGSAPTSREPYFLARPSSMVRTRTSRSSRGKPAWACARPIARRLRRIVDTLRRPRDSG